MLRLCIIDDEAGTRRGIRGLLDWAGLGIEVAGEAEDGREGIALIERVRPDIIICDVRMPRLDGIALVTHIRPAFPRLQIIFLSGHSEKAYLRGAIRFGAVDYLDKPVTAEELAAVIETAKARLQSQPAGAEGARQALAEVLLGGDAAALPKGLPVDFDGAYRVLIIRLRPGGEAQDTGLLMQRHQQAFEGALAAAAGPGSMLHTMGGQYVGYVAGGESSPRQLEAGLRGALDGLWEMACVSASEVHRGAGGLAEAYRQAQQANRSFFAGFGSFAAFSPALVEEAEMPSGAAEKIISLLEGRQFTRAAEALDAYVQRLRGLPGASEGAARGELRRVALHMAAQYRPGDQAFQFTTLERLERDCVCLPDIHDHLRNLLGDLISSLDSLSSKGRVVYDVERYIQENYARELTIAEIAQQVYLTPTYLCYLYKKATGQTLNTYITQVKMQKAKELLRDSSLKLSDIASMLGYSSQNYLTRLFTKACGMTPTAYRNNHL